MKIRKVFEISLEYYATLVIAPIYIFMRSGGRHFLEIFVLVSCILKFFGVISASWLFILSPVWIPAVLFVIFVILRKFYW